MADLAEATGKFYEVQGLALCPHHGDDPRRRGTCKVPVEGEWHSIYFVDSRAEADEILEMVLESDDPAYEKWEDFRVAAPDKRKRKRKCANQLW